MSSYSEFKQDAKNFTASYIVASIFIWCIKAIVFIITLGVGYFFMKKHQNKIINKNYYKI